MLNPAFLNTAPCARSRIIGGDRNRRRHSKVDPVTKLGSLDVSRSGLERALLLGDTVKAVVRKHASELVGRPGLDPGTLG
jgi:hypothetical protein